LRIYKAHCWYVTKSIMSISGNGSYRVRWERFETKVMFQLEKDASE